MWSLNIAIVSGIGSDFWNMKNLLYLDLSSNSLRGELPQEFGNMTSLKLLELSNNSLSGQIPNNIGGPFLQYIYASFNNITGPIPPSFAAFNSSLIVVDFSHNQITGFIPSQIVGSHLQSLRVLELSNNNLHGSIPPWIGELKALQVLDLSNNKLGGSIPSNINNLDGFKVVDNSIESSNYDPYSISQLRMSLTLQGVTKRVPAIRFTFFDISTNVLVGTIPPTLAELVNLQFLNISNNLIGGEIPDAIGTNMSKLISLDISRNNLSGPIPSTFTHLQSLATFNVSSNNLQGSIPTSTQMLTFTNASFFPGNDGLCGSIVNRSCSQGATNQSHQHNPTQEWFSKDRDVVSWSGFEVGITIGFCSTLLFIVSWSPAQNFVFRKSSRIKKVQPSHYGLFKPLYT